MFDGLRDHVERCPPAVEQLAAHQIAVGALVLGLVVGRREQPSERRVAGRTVEQRAQLGDDPGKQ